MKKLFHAALLVFVCASVATVALAQAELWQLAGNALEPASSLWAVVTQNVLPTVDVGASVGTSAQRFDYGWFRYIRAGNPSDAHTNVHVMDGSGDPGRVDFSVGLGSGFTSVYSTRIQPSFRWVGDGTGPVMALSVAPVLRSDGSPHTTNPFSVLRITMPADNGANLTVPILYGLIIDYAQAPGVANAIPLQVTGGTSTFADVHVQNGKLQLSTDAFVQAISTLSPLGSHVLALKDPDANASKFRVYVNDTNYLEMAPDGLRTSSGAINILTSSGRGWAVASDGSLVPAEDMTDIGTAAFRAGAIRATRLTVWGASQPSADLQGGYLGLGSGGSTPPDIRFYRTAPAAATIDRDGAGGDVTLTIAGALRTTGDLGIGTPSPFSLLHVDKGTNATTTVSFGRIGEVSSTACFNAKNTSGADISFYFVGTQMIVESNLCR